MGMYEDALPELKISSQYAANLAVLHNTWGYYYSKIGSISEAIEAFEKSIAENPEDFSTHNNLGLMFLQAGRGNQAKEAFEKSLSLNPDQAQLIDFMKTKGI